MTPNPFMGLWAPTLGRNLKIGNLDVPALAREPIGIPYSSGVGDEAIN